MGLVNSIKGQFLNVIQFEDVSNKLLVYKFNRPTGDNEIKQGSQVIVRESQAVAFLKGGQLADIFGPGTYTLTTKNMPILSTLGAFSFGFASPVVSDVYFISLRQFINNKWGTKNPILKRDSEFNMARISAFGSYAFKVVNIQSFMHEIFGTMGIYLTFDIIQYLSSIIAETVAVVIGETNMSIIDLATQYKKLSAEVQQKANEKAMTFGIQFSDMIIENLSLPEEVEKLIDEQSGIGMAKKDMDTFIQYQTARAMRDASKQKGGLAGLGVGMAAGNKMIDTFDKPDVNKGQSKAEKLRELKSLLDDGILTQEEFDAEKKKILQ